MSVVAYPMSTSTTPASSSSGINAARAAATDSRTIRSTSRFALDADLRRFCNAVDEPVTTCASTSRTDPVIPGPQDAELAVDAAPGHDGNDLPFGASAALRHDSSACVTSSSVISLSGGVIATYR